MGIDLHLNATHSTDVIVLTIKIDFDLDSIC